jgi:peptidoglycan/LPS O-acetylase OafA/YrhL
LSSTRHVHGLDGLRGVAALAVLLHHVENFRRSHGIEPTGLFERGYLAVDFFFILSGYVIGRAYEGKLRSDLTVLEYMLIRLRRLYPMLLVGMVLGVAFVRFNPREIGSIPFAFIAQLLFIPFAAGPKEMFPLNGVQWSLLFELFINYVHAVFVPLLSVPVIACIVVAGAMGNFVTARYFGNLGVGWDVAGFIGGFPRVFFGFFLGLLLVRTEVRWTRFVPAVPFVVVALGLLIVLAFPVLDLPGFRGGGRDFVVATFVFPAVVMLGVKCLGASRCADILGNLSYPLYAIHFPLLYVWGYFVVASAPTVGRSEFVLWASGIAGLVGLSLVLSSAIDRRFGLRRKITYRASQRLDAAAPAQMAREQNQAEDLIKRANGL